MEKQAFKLQLKQEKGPLASQAKYPCFLFKAASLPNWTGEQSGCMSQLAAGSATNTVLSGIGRWSPMVFYFLEKLLIMT